MAESVGENPWKILASKFWLARESKGYRGLPKEYSLKLAMCCLRASAMILSSDVTQAFLILADKKPDYEKMLEL